MLCSSSTSIHDFLWGSKASVTLLPCCPHWIFWLLHLSFFYPDTSILYSSLKYPSSGEDFLDMCQLQSLTSRQQNRIHTHVFLINTSFCISSNRTYHSQYCLLLYNHGNILFTCLFHCFHSCSKTIIFIIIDSKYITMFG